MWGTDRPIGWRAPMMVINEIGTEGKVGTSIVR